MLTVNFVAVLIAAVAAFIIGFLMHGPIGGKLWMKLAKITPTGNEKFSDMYGQMAWNLLANIVTAYVIAVLYSLVSTSSLTTSTGVSTGICVSILVWAGFIVTGSSMDVIWMGRSRNLWLFECLSSLLTLLAMGAIVSCW